MSLYASKEAKCIPATGKCEQYLELPRAIATSDGMPRKGDKANARSYLDKQYQSQLQDNSSTPDTVVIDGMFLIYTNPIPNTKMTDYVLFLIALSAKRSLCRGRSRGARWVRTNPSSALLL